MINLATITAAIRRMLPALPVTVFRDRIPSHYALLPTVMYWSEDGSYSVYVQVLNFRAGLTLLAKADA